MTAPARGVAHRGLAHVRREPGHASELVTQMILGEEALVLEERDGWLRARLGDGYEGWIHHGSLLRHPVGDRPAFEARLAARRPGDGAWVVTARGAVLRAGPEADAAPASDLVQGGIVRAAPERGALRVTLPDGLEGWLPAGDAIPADRLPERFPADGAAVLAHAGRFLGLPYLWGGTSEKGFDCSGMVQRILWLHGVLVPRDAHEQATAGQPVEAGEGWDGVRDGDLAFFAERPGRVTHVGFLAAGGRLLHASTSRNGVAWNALDPADPGFDDYGRRLVGMLTGIRRVIPSLPRAG